MAKNPASYQKRQRELDKKRKAEDKRKRRLTQKDAPPELHPTPIDRFDELGLDRDETQSINR